MRDFARRDQRHRARRGRLRSAVPGRAGRARLHPGRGRRDRELRRYVGPFSARAAQIGRNLDRYEARVDGRRTPASSPGRRCGGRGMPAPGPRAARTRSSPRSGAELRGAVAGRTARSSATATAADPVAAGADCRSARWTATARSTGCCPGWPPRRSAWNAADIRGEVERLIAARRHRRRRGGARSSWPRTSPRGRSTACVPLLDREGVPEHSRSLTSRHVLDVETDLVARLAARADDAMAVAAPPDSTLDQHLHGLDTGQRNAVFALAGD